MKQLRILDKRRKDVEKAVDIRETMEDCEPELAQEDIAEHTRND